MTEMEIKGTILYIGGFELPDKNAAAQRVLSNAKLFRLVGYETIFVGVSKEIAYNSSVCTTQFEYEGFSMFSVPYPHNPVQWMKYLTDESELIKLSQSIKNLKAIICYNFPAIVLEKIRKYCIKIKIQCVADVTEWYSVSGRSFPIKLAKGLDTFFRMRVVQKKIDTLIVISRYLERYYKKNKNVIYLPPLTDFNGINDQRCVKNHTDGLKLVYAGSPGLKDRINLLIEALAMVNRKVHLDIIGISESDYLKLYPEHKNKGLLSSNIVFHGRLSHKETVDYIKKADFSCFFRYDDRVTKAGFPTKFSEAISLGVPILTNRSSNIDEYVRMGMNGILVKDLNVDEIRKTIETIEFNICVDIGTFNYHRYIGEAKKILK